MALQLSIGIASNPRTWPILNGTVKPKGIELIPSVVHGSELFWRQLRFGDFDVSEFSFSSLMAAVAKGDTRWIGIPVFTTRRFFHTGILVRKDAGIETPADLKGKRVGVPEYQQTAALWTRGVLQHEFGVAPEDIGEFWMERNPDHSHGGATGFTPPPGVTLHYIPPEKSIGSMMVSGELDATLLYLTDPNLVDRSREDLWHHPDIRPLFPSPYEEGVRYYRKTGIYPINHGQAIRRSIAEEHPWVVESLFEAFVEANRIAEEQRLAYAEDHIAAGLVEEDPLRTTLVQHGIGANRKTLETAAQYSFEQGLTPRLMRLEDVFVPSLMNT